MGFCCPLIFFGEKPVRKRELKSRRQLNVGHVELKSLYIIVDFSYDGAKVNKLILKKKGIYVIFTHLNIHVVTNKKQSKKTHKEISAELLRKRQERLLRTCRKTILFNEKEFAAIDNYCKKYKIKSKSAFIRNVVISHILVDMDNNYPRLF